MANDDYRKQNQSAPGEQAFKYVNHPRETVSWYDAVAFCGWLSSKLGYEVRLPTEQEWEKAARGINGLEYPYGNDFNANRSNTREMGIGQTSTVGMFPDGESPYGVMDMSGNVWEWFLNEYKNPDRTQLEGSEPRVQRGGSWYNLRGFARSASRFSGDTNYRLDSFGFRVVRP